MSKYPLFFTVSSSTASGMQNNWQSQAPDLTPVAIAIPPEFSGPGGGYSPEDLFGMACLNCIIATFKVYAEHMNITFADLTGKAEVTVDKHSSNNVLAMTHIDLTFTLKGSSNPEKAKKVLEQAVKECAVCNSITSGKTYHINLE